MEQEYRMSNFENRTRDNILEGKKGAEVDWAMFCCYPDDASPVRMPSLFPIPSHIVRRRTVKTIDVNKYHKLVWAPEYVFGQGALIGRNKDMAASKGFNDVNQINKMITPGYETTPFMNGGKQTGDWMTDLSAFYTLNTGQSGQWDNSWVYDVPSPLTDDVANGGCRLIGAFIKLEYLGKVDNIQGLVEIAMNLNSTNTKDAQQVMHDIAFLTDDQMSQAPYYKSFRLSEGIRTIWFPIDESRFGFEEPVCAISKSEFDALYPGLWDADEVAANIIPTKLLTTGLSGQGGELWIPGITKQSKYKHRQENDNLHSRNRMEWAINFVGLTDPTPVRINIQYFYETCPHESYLDNFFPTKGPQGMTDVSTKMVQKVSQEIVPGPNQVSGTSIMMNTLTKLYDFAKPYIVPAIQMGATALGHPEVAAGIGLIKGLDWGGGNNNGYTRLSTSDTGKSYAKSTALMPYKKG